MKPTTGGQQPQRNGEPFGPHVSSSSRRGEKTTTRIHSFMGMHERRREELLSRLGKASKPKPGLEVTQIPREEDYRHEDAPPADTVNIDSSPSLEASSNGSDLEMSDNEADRPTRAPPRGPTSCTTTKAVLLSLSIQDTRQTTVPSSSKMLTTHPLPPAGDSAAPGPGSIPSHSIANEPSGSPTAVDDEESRSVPSPQPTIKRGRPSNKTKKLLEDAYTQIGNIIHDTSKVTGIPAEQIVDQYLSHANIPTDKSDWNIYQAYYAKNMSEQQALATTYYNERPEEYAKHDFSNGWKAKHCYPAYMHQHGKNVRQVLRDWYELQEIEDSSMETLQARKRRFNNWVEPMARALHQGGLHDFQGVLLVVGSLPNSDQGLARCVVGQRMPGLLTDAFKRPESDILALLQTAAYHTVVEANRVHLPPPPGVPDVTPVIVPGDNLSTIRRWFRDAFASAGKPFVGGRMPWATLAQHCAYSGVIIVGWPDGVRFPFQTSEGRGEQGVKSLDGKEQQAMVAAIQISDPTRKLRLTFGNIDALKQSHEPVIVCSPPSSGSTLIHAPRMFLDKHIDYKGPPRLIESQGAASTHNPSMSPGSRKAPSKRVVVASNSSTVPTPQSPPPPPQNTPERQSRETLVPSRSLSLDSDSEDSLVVLSPPAKLTSTEGEKKVTRRRRITTQVQITIQSDNDEGSTYPNSAREGHLSKKRVRNEESVDWAGTGSGTIPITSHHTRPPAPIRGVQPPAKKPRLSIPLSPVAAAESSLPRSLPPPINMATKPRSSQYPAAQSYDTHRHP